MGQGTRLKCVGGKLSLDIGQYGNQYIEVLEARAPV